MTLLWKQMLHPRTDSEWCREYQQPASERTGREACWRAARFCRTQKTSPLLAGSELHRPRRWDVTLLGREALGGSA